MALILLQRTDAHLAGAQLRDGAHGGARRRDRRVVGHALHERRATNGKRILDGLGARGRVDDELDVARQQAIHAVWAALAYLLDELDLDALRAQVRVRAGRRDDLEAEILEAFGDALG